MLDRFHSALVYSFPSYATRILYLTFCSSLAGMLVQSAQDAAALAAYNHTEHSHKNYVLSFSSYHLCVLNKVALNEVTTAHVALQASRSSIFIS